MSCFVCLVFDRSLLSWSMAMIFWGSSLCRSTQFSEMWLVFCFLLLLLWFLWCPWWWLILLYFSSGLCCPFAFVYAIYGLKDYPLVRFPLPSVSAVLFFILWDETSFDSFRVTAVFYYWWFFRGLYTVCKIKLFLDRFSLRQIFWLSCGRMVEIFYGYLTVYPMSEMFWMHLRVSLS